MRAQLKSGLGPSRKVVRQRDGAVARSLVHAIRDVLPERCRAGNGRLIHLLVLPNVVHATVACKGAQLLALGRTLAVGSVLLNIVLDEGVTSPAVDGD